MLKALDDGHMELSTAFLAVQDLKTYWPQFISYIGATGERQEIPPLEGKVCFLELSCVAFC